MTDALEMNEEDKLYDEVISKQKIAIWLIAPIVFILQPSLFHPTK